MKKNDKNDPYFYSVLFDYNTNEKNIIYIMKIVH